MAEAFYNATEGSGKKFHAWDRTIGANTVLDEFMIPGEYPLASYFIQAQAVSGATAAAHILQVMAGASLNVRIRRITAIELATGAAAQRIEVIRLTTAGTGGTAVTARPLDSADAAAGATGMTLPTVKGTEGVTLVPLLNTTATSGTRFEWAQSPNAKPIIIPAGTANGICLKVTGVASTTYDVWVELVETSFV